jgi:hypothetical protein
MYHTWDMFKLKYTCLWLIKLFVLFRVQHDKRSSSLEIYEDRLVTHKIGTYVRRYWTHSKVRDSVYLNPSTKLLWKWVSIFSFIMHPYRQFIPIQHAPRQFTPFQHAPKQTVYPNSTCTQTVHPVSTCTQTDSLFQFNMHPDSLSQFSMHPDILSQINMHPNRQFVPIHNAPRQFIPFQHARKQFIPIQHAPKQFIPIQHTPRQFIPIQHAPKQTVHSNYMLIFFCMTYSEQCLMELCSHFSKRNTCLILSWTFYNSLSNTQIIWWLWMKK